MENSALAVMARTAECAALLFIGYNLRSAQLFSTTDAEAAQRLAGYLTLPALLLHSCNALPPVSWQALIGGPVVALASAAAAAIAWLRFKGRHKRERALLCGAAVGADAPGIAVPFIEALAGPVGVVAACSAVAVNAIAVFVGSYLLTATAGPAFPEAYKHDDGGSYRGEWRGLSKEGLGVYTYPSGARYEGEWRNNLKDGRGVYYFPKGGTYEGEWAAGSMTGTGLRTYSTGKVTAGRWESGKLVAPLELWQCATAAEGAAEAAVAARRVVVGGGKPMDAVQQLIVQPVMWAALAGLLLNALAIPLPKSIAAITAALAPANKALMLLSAGMLLQPQLPQMRQVSDVTTVTATRIAAALFFTANALVLFPGCSHPMGRLSVVAAAAVLLSPITSSTLDFTRNFRLNESLSTACRDASLIAAAPLLLLLALGVGALGLLPVHLPGAAGILEASAWSPAAAAAAVDASGAATMFATLVVILAAVVAIAAGFVADRYAPERKVSMRYAGARAAAAEPGSSSSSSSSGGGPAATGPAPPMRAVNDRITKNHNNRSSSTSSRGGCSGGSSQQQQQQLYRRSLVPRVHSHTTSCGGSRKVRNCYCYAAPTAAAGGVMLAVARRQQQQQQQHKLHAAVLPAVGSASGICTVMQLRHRAAAAGKVGTAAGSAATYKSSKFC